jgi:hypothetical protein
MPLVHGVKSFGLDFMLYGAAIKQHLLELTFCGTGILLYRYVGQFIALAYSLESSNADNGAAVPNV